jgi:transposase
MAGELRAVRIPTPEAEALRDLVRAREDVRCDLIRARHRLSKFLLRHGLRFQGAGNWTQRHQRWLAQVRLDDPAAEAAFTDYLGAVNALRVRRSSLESGLRELAAVSPWSETVARLRCLRGVDTLTALGLCAELGEFQRFERAKQVMSFVGLVPSEQSTGERRRQGPITKSGSLHARRLLVEAAWHYRRRPSVGRELERRQDPGIVALSWRRNDAFTAPGSASTSVAASAAPWLPWPSRASSPASAGRWPPRSGGATRGQRGGGATPAPRHPRRTPMGSRRGGDARP